MSNKEKCISIIDSFTDKQSADVQKRIISAISNLPKSCDIKPLSGHIGLFRLRIVDFRIIYTVEDNILTVYVLQIDNREDIYRNY